MTDIGGTGRFDLGRVIGQTAALAWRNFIPFYLLSLILVGAPAFLAGYIPYLAIWGYVPDWLAQPSVWPFIAAIIAMASALVLQGALTRAAIDHLSTQRVNFGAALGTGLKLMFPLLGLGILVGIGVAIGTLLLIVPGIILALRWLVSAPVLVVEDTSITGAMERSVELTESHRWAILGLCVLYLLLSWGIGFVSGWAAEASATVATTFPGGASLFGIGVGAILQACDSMISTLGVAAIYFELRRVKEGVGVTELASVFD